MAVHKEDVAAAFDEMADLLDIQGANPFRVRAYRRAAQVVRTLPGDLAEPGGAQDLDDLPGIGADLAGKIEELRTTGRLRALEVLRRRVPAGLRALLSLPGLGPVRVRVRIVPRKFGGRLRRGERSAQRAYRGARAGG